MRFSPGCGCCCVHCIDPGPNPASRIFRVTIQTSGVPPLGDFDGCKQYNGTFDLPYLGSTFGACPLHSYRIVISQIPQREIILNAYPVVVGTVGPTIICRGLGAELLWFYTDGPAPFNVTSSNCSNYRWQRADQNYLCDARLILAGFLT